MNTDNAWEVYAKTNPYWAVLTDDLFLNSNLNEHGLTDFFASGESHVKAVHSVLKHFFNAPDRFKTSLDFGCGVGRLVKSLAAMSDLCVGVDISDTMLKISRENMRRFDLTNTRFIKSNESMSELIFDIDLLHSVIVFQHIPPERGLRTLNSLLKKLNSGGYGYIQLTFANTISSIQIESSATTGADYKYYQRSGSNITKLISSESVELRMQMNHYNLNEVMCLFHSHEINDVLSRQTIHENCLGIELFFCKK